MTSCQRNVSLVVVAFVLVALTVACGGSSSPVSPTPPGGGGGGGTPDVVITIVGMNGAQSYSPDPGVVAAGKTVAWRNMDSIAHTATADSGAFNTGTIAPGATSSPIAMPAAGSFAYHCSFHPTMTGTLTVQ